MRKYYIIPFLCICTLLLNACYEDKGNYIYKPAEDMLPIEIVGFESANYNILSNVHIAPQVKGIENEDDYEYVWYCYPNGIATQKADTLGYTKELDFVISFPLNQPRTVIYKITDKKTGIYKKASATITAVSAISKGWFILKEESGMTDLDIILPSGEILSDRISEVVGSKMEGEPVKMVFQPAYYYENASGKLVNDKQVYHVLSKKDFKTFDVGDLSVMKNFNDQFYTPEVPNLQDIREGDFMGNSAGIILLNNGKVHGYKGDAAHSSIFDYAKLGGTNLYPASLAYIFVGNVTALVFDMETSSFLLTTDRIIRLIDAPMGSGPISPVNMNADMIWMDQVEDVVNPMGHNGWALMKKLDDGKYLLIDLSVYSSTSNPIRQVTELDPSRKIITASVREPFQGDVAKAIYFAQGNVLSYYLRQGDDSPSSEKDIHTFPAGEIISHISHIYSSRPYTNKLAVTTNKDGKWKLYVFQMKNYEPAASPDIADTPPTVFTGNGNARWVIDRN